jgi:putative transposon-encoded protein
MKITLHTEIKGEEIIDGEVSASGNGAVVYVPKKWLGSKVKVRLSSAPKS